MDTKVIRTVYEALQDYCNYACVAFPVRPDDDLDGVYRLDAEDVEDLVCLIADLCDRSVEDYLRNPSDGIATVSELIELVCAQPEIGPAKGPTSLGTILDC